MTKEPADLPAWITEWQIDSVKRNAPLVAKGQAGIRALQLLKERGSLTMNDLLASFEADLTVAADPLIKETVEAIIKHLRPYQEK
ncbi:hypothetical protein [Rhodospirillum sp. A1_3_36]|uniref:hypothetical protein n=1 Tax=Rhodospirillum sp. A1_3_36 TaxID=3391666 RepID=UPI0039A642C1